MLEHSKNKDPIHVSTSNLVLNRDSPSIASLPLHAAPDQRPLVVRALPFPRRGLTLGVRIEAPAHAPPPQDPSKRMCLVYLWPPVTQTRKISSIFWRQQPPRGTPVTDSDGAAGILQHQFP